MNPLYKVFTIIETVVARQDTGLTYSEIIAALDLPKSSVHRILKDLTDLGYLDFNAATKRYSGSLRLAMLGAEVVSHFQLRTFARPYLLALHREVGHTTNMGVLDGTMGVFVDKIESKDFGIKLISGIGKTFPLYNTGLGKALLAFSPKKLFEEVVRMPLEATTEKTIVDPKKLERELARIRKQGFSLDNEEITRGIVCAAAPIFGYDGKLVGAVSITFPAYIKEDRGIEPEIEAIKKYAERISHSWKRA